jgi:dipeptidyl aminopeptidase/acylaminoacyl peptidase
VVSYTHGGRWYLALVDAAGAMSVLASGLEPHDFLAATPTHAVLVAGWAAKADAIVAVDLESGAEETLRASSTLALEPDDVSVPEPIEFSAEDGEHTHAFYYAPRNAKYTASHGDRPPLIAISHGGPTTAASTTLDFESAVLDQPRVRGGRRELRRQLGVWAAVPAAAERRVGHRRCA